MAKAVWEEGKRESHHLRLAGDVLTVTVATDAKRRRNGELQFGFRVTVFGSRMSQLFPDLETAKRKAEEQARKVLTRALDELAS